VAPSRTVHGAAERDEATNTTEAVPKAPQIVSWHRKRTVVGWAWATRDWAKGLIIRHRRQYPLFIAQAVVQGAGLGGRGTGRTSAEEAVQDSRGISQFVNTILASRLNHNMLYNRQLLLCCLRPSLQPRGTNILQQDSSEGAAWLGRVANVLPILAVLHPCVRGQI
jgi:hypothetical protein